MAEELETVIQEIDHQMAQFWNEMEHVMIGRKTEMKLMFTALLSEGHVLLEDLPGTGKTTMAKAFSKGLNCCFSRVQCTPDLLPSDVLGASVFNAKTSEFVLNKGPLFTNILLVDEINRALPRTQSSFLESMEERQASIEGTTYPLDRPFMVLATQNPIEMEGTFPLPEAQMDRFLMCISLGYPTQQEEQEMLNKVGDRLPYEKIRAVFSPDQIVTLQQHCRQVHANDEIREYITRLAAATRKHPDIQVGVSPRGSKALYKVVKAWALLNGRSYVIPDDVKKMAGPVWNHRLTMGTEARMNQLETRLILRQIIETIDLVEEKVLRYE